MPVEDKTVSWYEDFGSQADSYLITTIDVPAGEVWYLADYIGAVNEGNTELQIRILQGDGNGNMRSLNTLRFGGDTGSHNFNVGQYVTGLENHGTQLKLYYNGTSGADTHDGRGNLQIRRMI